MRRVEIITLFFVIIFMQVALCACGLMGTKKQETISYEDSGRKYEELDGIEDDLLIEYLFDHYNTRELLDLRYDHYWDYFEELGIPDIFIVIDELVGQGYADRVEQLKTIADFIGYYPSVIFGNYVADGNHVIHLTDGECFENIPESEIIPIGPFANIDELQWEIKDTDTYLNGYSLCHICCGNKASSMMDTVEHEDSSQHYESSDIAESSEHEDQGQYYDYYNSYRVDDLLADIEELENQIDYYEVLCDIYGYQTYDWVYNPEKWKYYIDPETRIAHIDWLCDDFDHLHQYYQTTQIESSDITECSKCSGVKIVFLDVNKGVFHSEKRKLDLGTDDYINIRVNYRFVSIENALKHGYTYCDCCNYE